MNKLLDSIITLAKLPLRSRPVGSQERTGAGRTLVVMGNGPSLADSLASHSAFFKKHDTMAVNFAANTPEFFRLRPKHYVLADPHFFSSEEKNVTELWSSLARVDWEMCLHLPAREIGKNPRVSSLLESNPNIRLRKFNMTPAEGYDFLCHNLFRRGLAMPRPRNVLIPAIMEGIREGYGEIFIFGAEHSWPHSLYVDDNNRVVTVQPHFYKENSRELDRIAEVYAGVRIHEVLGSMVVAFRSYHEIRRYADSLGVRIYNATPGSLIDAFPRRQPE